MGASGLATVEQNSVEDIAASVYALLNTERGSRLGDPDYGVEEAGFEQFPPEEAIDEWMTQIAKYEPRARVRTVAELEDLITHVTVRVGARP
jgi:phage baseplate assembly protein W